MATTTMIWNANATWICPPGVSAVFVECIAGGGGAGTFSTPGQAGGAGGGAYSSNNITATVGTSYAVVVGVGGNGATPVLNPSSPGGNSSFGTVCIAEGGLNSAYNSSVGVAGGAGANGTGDAKRDGGTGVNAPVTGGGGGGSSAGNNGNGAAGSGNNGGGQGGAAAAPGNAGVGGNGGKTNNQLGQNGTVPGGGGGGGTHNKQTEPKGGNGAAGRVWATYTTPAANQISDTFTTAGVPNTTLWVTATGNSGSIAVASGALTVTLASSNNNSRAYGNSIENYDLTGSSIYIQCTQAANLTACRTMFELGANAGNSLGMGIRADGNLSAWKQTSSTYALVVGGATAAYNATTMKWWRIRQSGSNCQFDYGPDGTTWTNMADVANPVPVTALQIQLYGQESTSTATPGTVSFDNLNAARLVAGMGRFALKVPYWYDTAYGCRKEIWINHGQVSGTQSNFPVLFSFTDADLKTQATYGGKVYNASGYDIIFVDKITGLKLAHEIESYTASSGAIVMWANVPTVSSTTDICVYMYFSNSSISTTQENVTGVWDSNYRAVFHLNGTPPSVTDSTTLSPGTNHGATATGGQISGGAATNGNNQYVSCSTANLPSGTSSVTVQAWANLTSAANATQYWGLIDLGTMVTGQEASLYTGDNTMVFAYKGGGLAQQTSFGAGAWKYLVGVYDGINVSLYVNGSLVGGPTAIGVTPNITYGNATVGSFVDTSGCWPGAFDEVRISNSVRTANWIATEYNNQKTASTFLTIGNTLGRDGMGRFRLQVFTGTPITLAGMGRFRFSPARTAIGRMRSSLAKVGMGRSRLSLAKAGMARMRLGIPQTRDSVGRIRVSKALAMSGRLLLSRAKAGMGRLRVSLARAGMARSRLSLARAGMARTRISKALAGMARERLSLALAGMGRMRLGIPKTLDSVGRYRTTAVRAGVGRLRSSLAKAAIGRSRLSLARVGMARVRSSLAKAGMARVRLSQARVGMGRYRSSIGKTLDAVGRLLLRKALANVGRLRLSLASTTSGRTRLSQAQIGQGRYRSSVPQLLSDVGRLRLAQATASVARLRLSQARSGMARLRLSQAAALAGRFRLVQELGNTLDAVGRMRVAAPVMLDLVGRTRVSLAQAVRGRLRLSLASTAAGLFRLFAPGMGEQIASGRMRLSQAIASVARLRMSVARAAVGRLRFAPTQTAIGTWRLSLALAGMARMHLSQARVGVARLRLSQARAGVGRTRISAPQLLSSVGRARLSVARAGMARLRIAQTRDLVGRFTLATQNQKTLASVGRIRSSLAQAGSGLLRLSRATAGMARTRISQAKAARGRTRLSVAMTLNGMARTRISRARSTSGRMRQSLALALSSRMRLSLAKADVGRLKLRAQQTLDLRGRYRSSLMRAGMARLRLSRARAVQGRFYLGGNVTLDSVGRLRLRIERLLDTVARMRLSLARATIARVRVALARAMSGRLRISPNRTYMGRLLLSIARATRSRLRLSKASPTRGRTRISQARVLSARLRSSLARVLTGRIRMAIEGQLDASGLITICIGLHRRVDSVARLRLSRSLSPRGRFQMWIASFAPLTMTTGAGTIYFTSGGVMPTIPITDDYSPRTVGDTSHPLICYFYDHSADTVTLTGVNFGQSTMTFKNRATGVSRTGSGSWAAGVQDHIAVYTWSAADVSQVGVFDMQATLQFPDGPLSFDPKPIEWLAHL